MDDTNISPAFKTTSSSVPSPSASHIAYLSSARLQIRCLSTFEVVRSIPVPSIHDPKTSRIAWSPSTPNSVQTSYPSPTSTSSRRAPSAHSNRILISDEDTTRVYDLRDEKWNAVISNGSGGMGKNVHVEFGASEDEVLVWSDFAACLKVWCLKTGRAVEIRDPKFSGKEGKGWGYRPTETSRHSRGNVLALLCRASGMDVLLLLAAETYTLLSRVELPTVDAANLRWSRDGRWLAIWDAASSGYRVHIYTVDGNPYRTIIREPSDDIDMWGIEGLGIKSVEWVPGDTQLAIGGWDRRVRILSTRTFAPTMFLDHTPTIHVPSAPVYTEHMDGQGNRSYVLTQQPITPPRAPLEKNETNLMKQGISIMAFNTDGTLCATRDDSTPSTVWIWDLRSLKPTMILIQYAPVKSLQWHPHDASRLLIHTTHDAPTVDLYTAAHLSGSTTSEAQQPPAIFDLSPHITKPTGPAQARWTTSWLSAAPDKKPVFILGHQQGYVLVWPDGKDQILRFEREDEEQEEDSLYDILTGRTPVPRLGDSGSDESAVNVHMGEHMQYGESVATISGLDDTFREQRERVNSSGTKAQQVGLDESGMDEMF